MTALPRLYALLSELSRHPTATAAANALARVMTDSCGANYAAVYLRDYTGEELILSGSAPSPVKENSLPPQRIPAFDINHPLAYCMQLGRPVTLPISALVPETLSGTPENNFGNRSATACADPAQSEHPTASAAPLSGVAPSPAITPLPSESARPLPGGPSSATSVASVDSVASVASARSLTEPHAHAPSLFDSFYPLMAPGEHTIGVLVIGHGRNFQQDKHALSIVCLYASVIINTAIIDRRNKALVSSLNEDLQRYDLQEQEQQKLAKSIVGTSAATEALRTFVLKAAKTDASIFITGETGTGKSLVAKIIHEHSHRKDGPFMEINCGGIAPNLLESELFGHVKGAFSGAISNHPGLLRTANGGTVFLDEIGELPASLQTTLLQVTQEKTVRPVGSVKQYPVNIRLLAATNRSMPEALNAKEFRPDLYHRLAELTIHIPPLRERPEDIRALCGHLFGRLIKKYDCPRLKLSPEAIQALTLLPLEGNVRELSNLLEQCILVAAKSATAITAEDLASQIQNPLAHHSLAHNRPACHRHPCSQPNHGGLPLNGLPHNGLSPDGLPPGVLPPGGLLPDGKTLCPDFSLVKQLEAVEAAIISKALDQCAGDIRQCAKLLGIHTKTLTRRLTKYGLGAGQRRELWN